MSLSIPEIAEHDDVLAAALKYAAAGWYILPVAHGTKHPGSRLGKGWPGMSSRDPKVIVAWLAGTDDGIALHVGRSGAVVFDVDKPENLPEVLAVAIEQRNPPFQTTRADELLRGHYVFRAPARGLGNGHGHLGTSWGEVRGRNGVIVVEPSSHPKLDGLYRWQITGDVPELTDDLSDQLPRGGSSPEDAVSDTDIRRFIDTHTSRLRPNLVKAVAEGLSQGIESGAGRHGSAVTALCWAAREIQAGLYTMDDVTREVWPIFRDAIGGERNAGAEWLSISAWAIGQAAADNPMATRERVLAANPEASVLDTPMELPDAQGGAEGAERPTTAEGWADFLAAHTKTRDELEDTAPSYLIKGVLWKSSDSWLIAKSGSFKSFVAIDWACHVVMGAPWLGRRVKHGPVLYVAAEGEHGIQRRIKAWEAEHQRRVGKDLHVLPMAVYARDGAAWGGLRILAERLGAVLIVIDTQARVTAGMDENSNSEMGAWVERVAQLRRATSACVLVVHHQGRGGRDARGASAIDAAQDTEWSVQRDDKDPLRAVLHLDKSKDGEDGIEIPIVMKVHPVGLDEDAETITSLALVGADAAPVVMLGDADPTGDKAWILKVMRRVGTPGGETIAELLALVNEERANAGAPKMGKTLLRRALYGSDRNGRDSLQELGFVENVGTGVAMRWALTDRGRSGTLPEPSTDDE